MKLLFALLTVSVFIADTARSQTGSGTATTPSNTTTTPVSTTMTPSFGGPPATAASPSPMAASPNRRQELYDQHHGITRKPSSLASGDVPVERPATRPASSPAPMEPVARVDRPVSSVSTSGVRIGVRGGITRPVYLETLIGATIEPTIGFVGGFVFQFGRGILSFQPELNYARYASKRSGLFSGSATNFAIDRFEVPLFLKIASGPVDGNRLFLNVGPYGAYVAGASLNSQKASLNGSGGRFSFGAAAGVGAALKAGPGHLTIELRGLYDLTNSSNVNADGSVRIGTGADVVNAQATVGYIVPLGGR